MFATADSRDCRTPSVALVLSRRRLLDSTLSGGESGAVREQRSRPFVLSRFVHENSFTGRQRHCRIEAHKSTTERNETNVLCKTRIEINAAVVRRFGRVSRSKQSEHGAEQNSQGTKIAARRQPFGDDWMDSNRIELYATNSRTAELSATPFQRQTTKRLWSHFCIVKAMLFVSTNFVSNNFDFYFLLCLYVICYLFIGGHSIQEFGNYFCFYFMSCT